MTPARTGKGKGCYEFDRVIPDVGRIRQTSGTRDLREFRRRDAILTKLHETAQLELLRAFKERKLTIEALVEHDRHGRGGETLEVLKLQQPLWAAIAEQLPRMGGTHGTRERYELSFRTLRASCPQLGARATVADLQTVDWWALHTAWPNGPADWNRMRAAVGRFLTLVTGHVHSPFRLKVMAPLDRQEEPEGRTPDLSPAQFLALLERIVDDDVRAALIAIVLTGMRIGEYLSLDRTALQPTNARIRIPDQEGNKTRGRVMTVHPDDWGWIVAAVPFGGIPLSTTRRVVEKDPRYRRIWKHWKAAQAAAGMLDATGRVTVTLHDLRHCTGQWASDAGQADRSIQTLLGQKDPRMTARYTKQKDARNASRAVGATLNLMGGR